MVAIGYVDLHDYLLGEHVCGVGRCSLPLRNRSCNHRQSCRNSLPVCREMDGRTLAPDQNQLSGRFHNCAFRQNNSRLLHDCRNSGPWSAHRCGIICHCCSYVNFDGTHISILHRANIHGYGCCSGLCSIYSRWEATGHSCSATSACLLPAMRGGAIIWWAYSICLPLCYGIFRQWSTAL